MRLRPIPMNKLPSKEIVKINPRLIRTVNKTWLNTMYNAIFPPQYLKKRNYFLLNIGKYKRM
jgi:hypothetical protein